jgi:hypothetical protein
MKNRDAYSMATDPFARQVDIAPALADRHRRYLLVREIRFRSTIPLSNQFYSQPCSDYEPIQDNACEPPVSCQQCDCEPTLECGDCEPTLECAVFEPCEACFCEPSCYGDDETALGCEPTCIQEDAGRLATD